MQGPLGPAGYASVWSWRQGGWEMGRGGAGMGRGGTGWGGGGRGRGGWEGEGGDHRSGSTGRARRGAPGTHWMVGGRGRGSASKEALDSPHQRVQGRAGVAQSKVGGGEAADEAIDAEAAHGLVAETEAGGGVAFHNEPPLAYDLTMLVYGKHA